MNKMITALALGASLLGGAYALAQNDAPGTAGAPGMAGMPGMAMPPLGDTDKQFLTEAAQGSVADYANGAAAVNRAQNPAVRQLGIWFMEDHDRLNISLFALAGTKGLNLPLTMTAQDQSDLTTLTTKQGADFDRAWLQQAIKTNKQDISDAERQAKTATDPEVKPMIRAYLSTEYGHLAAAQTIIAGMGKATGRR